MKILGLLRHAKSDWDDTAQRDFDRGLNARGKKGAELIGKHIGVKAFEETLHVKGIDALADRLERAMKRDG